MFLPDLSDRELAAILADDAGRGDLTTHLLGIGAQPATMRFAARQSMVVACCEEAERLLRMAGCTVERWASSGERLNAGALILAASGSAGAIHRGWKVAQNLIEIASGIATNTRQIVDAARAIRPAIAVVCTRKTVPGAKLLMIKAIMAGGASPHRLGLAETILIFAEHRAFLRGEPPEALMARLKAAAPEKKVMVEVASVEDAVLWSRAGSDVIQVDKLPPAGIEELVRRLAELPHRPIISAAGGINERNAADYAHAGADVLVTSAPYTAKPADVAVTIEAMV
jgi:molybdenum transport protein